MGLKIAIVLSFLATCGKALKISDAENWIVVYMMPDRIYREKNNVYSHANGSVSPH